LSQSAWSVMPANALAHEPVLAHEVTALLDVAAGMTVVDGTFGAGGHAAMLAEQMHGRGAYVAIDRDPSVEARARAFRAAHPDMAVRLMKRDFVDAFRSLAVEGVRADAVLLDLGVSSMQIDQPERGFSYTVDAPLDMRMDPRDGETAADLLARLPERELAELFARYGEERYARQIAKAICRRRREQPYERSADLVETMPGGRLAVISFHSLEDRLVKEAFRSRQTWECLTRSPVVATEEEIGRNPRSRSAKLRVASRTPAAG